MPLIYDALCHEWVEDLAQVEEDYDDYSGFITAGDACKDAIILLGDDFCGVVRRDPDASAMAYSDYLNSPHWRLTRERARQRAGGSCQKCHSTGRRLDVHHRTYSRLGCEAELDLIVLCDVCHRNEHGIVK